MIALALPGNGPVPTAPWLPSWLQVSSPRRLWLGPAWHTLGQQTRRAAHAAQVQHAIVQQVQQTDGTRELAAQPEVRDQLLQKLQSY